MCLPHDNHVLNTFLPRDTPTKQQIQLLQTNYSPDPSLLMLIEPSEECAGYIPTLYYSQVFFSSYFDLSSLYSILFLNPNIFVAASRDPSLP